MIDEGNTYIFLFNLRHIIHIPSFCLVNLLCYGCHFIKPTFIDSKTYYRSPYLLDFYLLDVS